MTHMAKIHRVSTYFVDPNAYYDEKTLEARLNTAVPMGFTQQCHVESSPPYPWRDDLPENFDNCDLSELAKHFPCKSSTQTRPIEAGKRYCHFKGHVVEVIAVAEDTENAGNLFVVYRHTGDGRVWARPYDMFASEVDHTKYPDVKQRYRFEEINDA